MEKHFTHLHLHSDYSLLDGAITIKKLIKFGKEQKMKALAITDHGNIFGAVKFFESAKQAGIRPILGMEAYFTEDASLKLTDNKYYHLIILVQNAIGYKNLCKLIAYSYQEGFYFKPRIDYKLLEKYNEGLVVTSACLGGHIPSLLMQEQYGKADERIDWFLRVFGEERFYLEVQPEDQKDQIILNNRLYEVSKRRGIQLLAAGDCHYVSLDDHEAHETMLAIQTHAKVSDTDRFSFGDCRAYMRTQDEMLAIFKDHEEAVWNSGKIADSCTFEFETGKLFFPKFELPPDYTEETYFHKICLEGLEKLLASGRIDLKKEIEYRDRLELEITLIIKMGFVGYFLVVSDFIAWARAQNIPVGPGRGSAAGSLVAWSLQITDIDPLKYNLLFERFLNPERVSMPDIDIDFCINGRDAVINYVKDRYGHDKVCQIITFGTMLAKGVIKDVARALGFPFEDSNTLTNFIPEQLKITLDEAIKQEPKLQEMIDSNPQVAKLFDLAKRLEGVTRHASKHAAGIVIAPEPISDMLPVFIPPKTQDLVTQYAMTELETLGFLKMDFLGLKNLTLIQQATGLIKKIHGTAIDITRIPLDDHKTFALLCKGETSGVFQLESSGLKDVLRRLQPACFEDIIAVNALYRPGPLGSGMVDDFIERKHGRQEIMYLFPELEPLLKETYGVIVYQEQVIKIASTIGGYSLGEADILRRAMGKKKAEVMDEQRKIFMEKATARMFDPEKAKELFDLMAYFAGYGFNKSHSAAYALIAYQTAYLKANYPAEFLACLISLEMNNAESMAKYVYEARDCGLKVLPPDINESETDFTVVQGVIRFGLKGIKSVGLAALESMLAQRLEGGPFKDLFDFCKRIDLRTCNKRVIENLISAGAFDSLPGNRAQKHEELPKIMEQALHKKKSEMTGQMGLFDIPVTANDAPVEYRFQPLAEWSNSAKLEKEKEVLGLYISSQPLDTYAQHIQWLNALSFQKASELPAESLVITCGTLKTYKVITTKKGDKMAFALFEDYVSKAEIVIFPKLFALMEEQLKTFSVFMVKGALSNVDASSGLVKIKAETIIPLDLIFEHTIATKVVLTLPESVTAEMLALIKQKAQPGTVPLEIHFIEQKKRFALQAKDKITITEKFLKELKEYNILAHIYT
jgi:DNA polymerase-3 subunit alpha